MLFRSQQARDARGCIRGGSYIVREIPNRPHPESPDTAVPEPAAPYPVEPEALTTTEVNLLPSTTTTTYNTKERYSNLDQPTQVVAFPDWISAELQCAACEKVARCEPILAQMLIDEWADAINAGKIKKSPLGYLHELAARLDRNQFTCHDGQDLVQTRTGESFLS